MNNKLFNLLEPKIGHDAARVAVQDRRNMIIMVIIAFTAVISFNLVPLEVYPPVFGGFSSLILIALAFAIYTKIRFAKLISQRYNKKVAWYAIPGVIPAQVFDIWLESLKSKSGR